MKGGGQVGFSQRIRLDWLDYTAIAVLAGNGKDDIAAALRERLRDALLVQKRSHSAASLSVVRRLPGKWSGGAPAKIA